MPRDSKRTRNKVANNGASIHETSEPDRKGKPHGKKRIGKRKGPQKGETAFDLFLQEAKRRCSWDPFPARAHEVKDVNKPNKCMLIVITGILWCNSMILICIGASIMYSQQNDTMPPTNSISSGILSFSASLFCTGLVCFVLNLCGFIGVLRENIIMIRIFYVLLIIFVSVKFLLGIFAFMFTGTARFIIGNAVGDEVVLSYRANTDIELAMDYLQATFECCGLREDGFKDWSRNMYFNCSDNNPSAERCGVPWSCCRNGTGLENALCGRNMQTFDRSIASRTIHTRGCVLAMQLWAERHTISVGVLLLLDIVLLVVVIFQCVRLVNELQMLTDVYRGPWWGWIGKPRPASRRLAVLPTGQFAPTPAAELGEAGPRPFQLALVWYDPPPPLRPPAGTQRPVGDSQSDAARHTQTVVVISRPADAMLREEVDDESTAEPRPRQLTPSFLSPTVGTRWTAPEATSAGEDAGVRLDDGSAATEVSVSAAAVETPAAITATATTPSGRYPRIVEAEALTAAEEPTEAVVATAEKPTEAVVTADKSSRARIRALEAPAGQPPAVTTAVELNSDTTSVTEVPTRPVTVAEKPNGEADTRTRLSIALESNQTPHHLAVSSDGHPKSHKLDDKLTRKRRRKSKIRKRKRKKKSLAEQKPPMGALLEASEDANKLSQGVADARSGWLAQDESDRSTSAEPSMDAASEVPTTATTAEASTASNGVAPATSHDVTPATAEEIAPPTSHDITPAKSHDVTPPTSHDITPPTTHDVTPATAEEIAPPTTHNVAPATSRDIISPTTHDIAPVTAHDVTPATSHDVTTLIAEEVVPSSIVDTPATIQELASATSWVVVPSSVAVTPTTVQVTTPATAEEVVSSSVSPTVPDVAFSAPHIITPTGNEDVTSIVPGDVR